MMCEPYERLGRCVVCCDELSNLGHAPAYCEDHGHEDELSMPPIPMHEWWRDDPADPFLRFETGSN